MKKGLSSNELKIIAVILMVIDHIGFYMYKNFNYTEYYMIRSIGRLAMPIFAYLLVQGFFYTKNLKKYIFRIFILATITQTSLIVLGFINQKYYPNYLIGMIDYLGVLYSYTFSLIMITIIDRKIIIKKLSYICNWVIRILSFIVLLELYVVFKVEFEMQIPIIVIGLYVIENLFQKENKLLLKSNEKIIKKSVYILLIVICFFISTIFVRQTPGYRYMIVMSSLIIAVYNGERGKNSKFIQSLFYLIFPIQHIALYLLGMIS